MSSECQTVCEGYQQTTLVSNYSVNFVVFFNFSDIHYSLVMGGDNFSIHAEYGMMHTTAVLDYEDVKSYQLIVKATVGDTALYGLCLV